MTIVRRTALKHEEAVTFPCEGEVLVGVLHRSDAPPLAGVVMVVGGPQYRAGAHRQYVLLARALAAAGVAVLRFDLRGMGDSGGPFRGFEDCGADIAAAVACLRAKVPEVPGVVLWGLCDGATAIAFHLAEDAGARSAVAAAVLVNPWARSARTEAAARARHYYVVRLASADFWRKLGRGRVAVGSGLRDAVQSLGAVLATLLPRARSPAAASRRLAGGPEPLPDRLAEALRRLPVPARLILSGRDLTAKEFETAVLARPEVAARIACGHLRLHRLPEANHTFSTVAARERVLGWTLDTITGDEEEA